uniref:Uncharacterized protein n=1 Tax=Meloidogyne incognita TaxID=6306 RepID=A0A914LV43_MELIC
MQNPDFFAPRRSEENYLRPRFGPLIDFFQPGRSLANMVNWTAENRTSVERVCQIFFLLLGSEDGKVYIWDLVESTLIAKLEHPAGFKFVPSLSTHPKDPCILTASREKIFLWQCPE